MMQQTTKADVRTYGPIVTACLNGERERAIELVLNAAEGLMAENPTRYPMLADALDECRSTLMSMALELGEGGYLPITASLGLALEVPTPDLVNGRFSLLDLARVDPIGLSGPGL